MFDSMVDAGALALLQQGYRNNWQRYLASLNGPEATQPAWDICVLTASNARQAEAYEAQLEVRRRAGLLPRRTQFQVIADPEGLRIGSGGATLRVLTQLARQIGREQPPASTSEAGALAGKRILMVHSGGDSRRLPHCSATGKFFARVPHELPDGRPSSLFDEFLVSLSGLPGQIPEGVLVASGDVLLLFDHLQLHLNRPGIIGVAAATPAELGTHHGIYVTAGSSHQVRSFLHKPSLARMEAEGALQADGRVQIDTGLVWIDRSTLDGVLYLAEQLSEAAARGVTINLYGDLLAPLAQTATLADYLADESDGPATALLREVRQLVWTALRGTPFSVERLYPAVFVHFGTTGEYLEVMRQAVRVFQSCGWRHQAASWVAPAISADEHLVAMNAYVGQGANKSACLIDSHLETQVELGEQCLLANVSAEGSALTLAAGMALQQLPLRGAAGYVTRLYGVTDDPKRTLADGGTFLNVPWRDWLDAAHLAPQDLWPSAEDAQCSLWDARLYPPCATREESLGLVLWMQTPEAATAETVARWRRAPRLSLGDSYLQADVRRLVQEQGEVEDAVRTRRFFEGVERERPAAQLDSLGAPPDAARRARLVADWIEASIDPWLPLRGYRALSVSTGDGRWDDRAFSALARLVRAHTAACAPAGMEHGARHGASVRAAARIDFGGGWSDTPPYSLERGGAVLNAAITLRQQHPIGAQATFLDDPVLVLESRDGEATIRPRFAGEVLNYANPADPFALLKAALVFRGIVPADSAPEAEIAEVLRPLGCGVHLSTETSIPRGSGLGTSSILAGTVLQCLAHALGQAVTPAQLFDEVLCLEQMITTGGGWQDQIGGLTGGIKLITTPPGLPQLANVQAVPLSPRLRRALDERLLLVYTGQQRLAKGLLRAIMGRFMARDPEMVAMLRDIARLGRDMREALLAEDLETFGELIAQHWQVNKRMDPDCTNPFIDELLAQCRPYMVGAKLAGAGGGGFAIVIAQDSDAARSLGVALRARFPQSDVGVWACRVAEEGLVRGT